VVERRRGWQPEIPRVSRNHLPGMEENPCKEWDKHMDKQTTGQIGAGFLNHQQYLRRVLIIWRGRDGNFNWIQAV